jgi:quercetin dioxygenase-like cupin family protein
MVAPLSPQTPSPLSSAPAAPSAPSAPAAPTASAEDREAAPVLGARPFERVAASVTLDSLPGRVLDRRELRGLARAVAADRELWQRHVAFDDDNRHYVCLHRDAHVDVWLLCWTPRNDTGWHDHDISCGAVAVADGTLVEHNLAVGRPSLATEVHAGQVYCFGPDHIHRITGRAAASVSVHAYSPPLGRMGQYTVSRTGILRRTSVSYADELRALDGV